MSNGLTLESTGDWDDDLLSIVLRVGVMKFVLLEESVPQDGSSFLKVFLQLFNSIHYISKKLELEYKIHPGVYSLAKSYGDGSLEEIQKLVKEV